MKFATISQDFPIGLAPMAGFTDRSFRILCREFGADLVVTEMVSAKGLLYGNERTGELLATDPGEQPLFIQLFGREPDTLAEAVKGIYRQMEGRFAGFDLNMGCPAHKITGNGEGSALMKDPPLAGRIIRAVAEATPLPVSVKFRKGWDEAHADPVGFGRICEENGASMVAVHPRTRDQQYGGKADWDVIRRVKDALSIPVLGNGDVRTGADARRMREETGCDGILVGRGALGNPWIFPEIHAALAGTPFFPPAPEERRRMALRQAKMAIDHKGPHAVVEMRKQIGWYLRGTQDAASLRERINNAKTFEELAEILT